MRRPGGLQASLECGGAPTRPGQRCMQRRQSGVTVCSQMLLAVRVNPSFAAPKAVPAMPSCMEGASSQTEAGCNHTTQIAPLCTGAGWPAMGLRSLQ